MSKFGISFVIFIAGSCNLIYELCLAQMTSSFFGGTLYQYTFNIGLFILSMGAGSLLAERVKDSKVTQLVLRIEISLFILGAGLPFYTVFSEKFFSPLLFHCVLWLVNIALGLLSGLELPLFNRLLKSNESTSEILFADYLGMFFGSIAFSFFLFPVLGVFSALWAAALLNLLALSCLLFLTESFSRKYLLFSAGALLTSGLLIFYSENLLFFLQRQYVS